MNRIECPNCGSLLEVDSLMKLGKVFECPDCETELVVINITPFEIDYYYGEEIDDSYSDDFDEYSDIHSEEEYHHDSGNNFLDYEQLDD